MTVKEIIKLLKEAEVISIGFAEQAIRICSDDSMMLSVFGDYVVDSVLTDDGKTYELNVVMQPVKVGV